MYIWTKLRDNIYPKLYDLKEAFKRADNSDPLGRDVRDLMSALMRVETTSPRISGHILTRRTAVTSFSWNIIPNEETDQEKADLVKLRVQHAVNAILKYRLQAPLYGTMVLEWNWNTAGIHGTTPQLLKRYLPVELEKYDDATIYTLEDSDQLSRVDEIAIAEPGTNFTVEVDESYQRGGILRKLAIDQIILWDNILEWSNLNRKLKGIIQGIVKAFANDAERAAAEKALRELALENFSITTDATEFSFNQMADAKAKDSFKDLIEMFNANASIAILGQANTSELPDSGGSRAALQVLQKVSADIHYNDIIAGENLVNDLLLKDYQMNIDQSATEVPWKFKINLPEEVDLIERAEFVGQLKQNGIAANADEIYNMLGIQKPETVSEILFVSPTSDDQP